MAAMIAVTAIESRRNNCLIVGEDLGTVPDGLRAALSEADILSYRVLWFEREGEGFRRPEDYPAMALACLASHDLPTFAGWRAGRDIDIGVTLGQTTDDVARQRHAERRNEVAALDALTGASESSLVTTCAAAHRFLARSPSRVMLVQADDLAGETDPLNLPGTDREWPNWRRRVGATVEEMANTALAEAVLAAVKEERPQ
jgi:glycogen operon protein